MPAIDYTFRVVDANISTSKITVVYTSNNNFHSPVTINVLISDPNDAAAVELEISRLAPLDFWLKQDEQPFPLPEEVPVLNKDRSAFLALVGLTTAKTSTLTDRPAVLGSYERAILQVTRDLNSTIAIAEKI